MKTDDSMPDVGGDKKPPDDDPPKYPNLSRKDLANEMFDVIEAFLKAHYENDERMKSSAIGGMRSMVKSVRGDNPPWGG